MDKIETWTADDPDSLDALIKFLNKLDDPRYKGTSKAHLTYYDDDDETDPTADGSGVSSWHPTQSDGGYGEIYWDCEWQDDVFYDLSHGEDDEEATYYDDERYDVGEDSDDEDVLHIYESDLAKVHTEGPFADLCQLPRG